MTLMFWLNHQKMKAIIFGGNLYGVRLGRWDLMVVIILTHLIKNSHCTQVPIHVLPAGAKTPANVVRLNVIGVENDYV